MKRGAVFENGTAIGATAEVVYRRADIVAGKIKLSTINNEFMTPSTSFMTISIIVVVPIGEPYSNLEKLTLPFENYTWIAITIFYVLSLVFIVFVKLILAKWVQNFILGRNSSSEYFNTFVTFVGQNVPDPRVPGRNFARTLFCIFMLYALVIRSSYSGELFKFLKSDHIRKPHVKSVNEMIEKDFKFYMHLATSELIKEEKKVYSRKVIVKNSQIPEIEKKMDNSDFKAGLLASHDRILYENRMNQNLTLNICPEVLFTLPVALYFQKNSALAAKFSKVIDMYKSNGLINYWIDEFIPENVNRKKQTKAPHALTFEKVSASFDVLIIGYFAACIAFFVEICVRKMFYNFKFAKN